MLSTKLVQDATFDSQEVDYHAEVDSLFYAKYLNKDEPSNFQEVYFEQCKDSLCQIEDFSNENYYYPSCLQQSMSS